MNNIYKVLIGAAVGLLVGSVIGWALAGNSYGGVTNYDSLQLQPSSSSDDALDVRDSGGTSRFVVDGSGVITLLGTTTVSGAFTATSSFTVTGAFTASGAFTATGESRVNRVRNTGSVLTIASTSVATLTDTQLCDNGLIQLPEWGGIGSSTAVLNLPTAEAVFANCLPTNGDRFSFILSNLASASGSSTLITAGSASTTLFGFDNSEDILLGGSRALIEVWRVSPTAMHVGIQNWVEAD